MCSWHDTVQLSMHVSRPTYVGNPSLPLTLETMGPTWSFSGVPSKLISSVSRHSPSAALPRLNGSNTEQSQHNIGCLKRNGTHIWVLQWGDSEYVSPTEQYVTLRFVSSPRWVYALALVPFFFDRIFRTSVMYVVWLKQLILFGFKAE